MKREYDLKNLMLVGFMPFIVGLGLLFTEHNVIGCFIIGFSLTTLARGLNK